MRFTEEPFCNIASCDEQGHVLLMQDCVFRIITWQNKESILDILETIKQNNLTGIVSTTIHNPNSSRDQKSNPEKKLILKHEKIKFISYPNEWCASMLKDAAIFHIKLAKALYSHNLFLKDAHPWNILFDNGKPIFVDFTSITNQASLFKETFLQSNSPKKSKSTDARIASIINEIHSRMYIPYFIRPLEAYFILKNRSHTRRLIESTTINTSKRTINLFDNFRHIQKQISTVNKIATIVKTRINLKIACHKLTKNNSPLEFFKAILEQIQNINSPSPPSGYINYYKAKGEDNCIDKIESWNKKQYAVYDAINSSEIKSVLDVACNTGWFAILAEHLGKDVVAIDIDESCIEMLYEQVKEKFLNILPLVLDITKPTSNRSSIFDDGLILINAHQRLRADSVIALGIFHHLTLGQGFEFEEVLSFLIPLCKKQLIIEFVALNDLVIQNEPEFFPTYYKNKRIAENYRLEVLILLCEKHGFLVHQEPSHPNTRTILVCTKRQM